MPDCRIDFTFNTEKLKTVTTLDSLKFFKLNCPHDRSRSIL